MREKIERAFKFSLPFFKILVYLVLLILAVEFGFFVSNFYYKVDNNFLKIIVKIIFASTYIFFTAIIRKMGVM